MNYNLKRFDTGRITLNLPAGPCYCPYQQETLDIADQAVQCGSWCPMFEIDERGMNDVVILHCCKRSIEMSGKIL